VQADDPETAVSRIIELVETRIPKRFGLDSIRDIQVLCPMNRGGVGARSLNIELKAALNPAGERKVERFGWTFAPGDKVMQIENDYDKEVYNGDIGYIDDVDPEAGWSDKRRPSPSRCATSRAGGDGRNWRNGCVPGQPLPNASPRLCHKSVAAGPAPGQARHASQRRSQAGAKCRMHGGADGTGAPKGQRTATTSMADIPRRSPLRAGGYERPLNCFSVLGSVSP
jgi:hypothetical protein